MRTHLVRVVHETADQKEEEEGRDDDAPHDRRQQERQPQDVGEGEPSGRWHPYGVRMTSEWRQRDASEDGR